MHLGRSVHVVAAALALDAVAPRAAKAAPTEVVYSLQYLAQDACPNEAAFAAEIAARTARAVRRAPDRGTTHFEVVLRSESDASSGTLTVRQPDGSHSARSVRAPTCSEVGAALALVVALTLDPQASLGPAPSPPPRGPSPQPSSSSSAMSPSASSPSASSPTPGPLPTAPSSASSDETSANARIPRSAPTSSGRANGVGRSSTGAKPQPRRQKPISKPGHGTGAADSGSAPDEGAEPTEPSTDLLSPAAVPAPAPTPKPLERSPLPKPPRSSAGWTLSAGAGLDVQAAAAPWWMAGGFLHAAGAHRSGWGAGASVAAFPTSQGTTDGVTASFKLWTARGEGCYAGHGRGRFRVLGCVAFEGGRLTAAGEPGGPIATGVSGSAGWFAAVAIGRIAIPAGPFTIEGQGELLVPISRDQFGVRTGPEFSSKHRPSALAVGARLGVAYRFWE